METMVKSHRDTWRLERNLNIHGRLVGLNGRAIVGHPVKLFMPNGMVAVIETGPGGRFGFQIEAIGKSGQAFRKNMGTIGTLKDRAHSYVPIFLQPD